MLIGTILCALLFLSSVKSKPDSSRYEPTWDSLDSRPLPNWYDQAKVGIFLHWGVYSVPSFRSEWFWWYWQGSKEPDVVKFMQQNYRPDFTYPDFASNFRAEFYDPAVWADLFNASGARYVVLTSKHHEGFSNWPSKYSWNWNSGSVGPGRDLVGELGAALRSRTKLRFGLYYSLFEWFNPLYNADSAAKFASQTYVKTKAWPQIKELIETYRPDILWSDGDAGPVSYWNSTDVLAWLYNDSPVKDTIVTNDRWGDGTGCKHGGFYTCADRYNPGKLVNHKWENCLTIDGSSWGYRREAQLKDFLTIEELIEQIASTVSCGGNVLINVGPTSDGRIVPIFEERLRQMGRWLATNGEAIYESKPWTYQNDTNTTGVWYTAGTGSGAGTIYAILLRWPDGGKLYLGAPLTQLDLSRFVLIGGDGSALKFVPDGGGIRGVTVYLPGVNPPMNLSWAYVLKMTGVA